MKNFIQKTIEFLFKTNTSEKRIPIPSLIPIPNQDVIDCEIQTPQFKNGKVHKMYKQTGRFYKSDMVFIHDGLFTGHNVHFQNIDDFQKSLIRIF
jgi:hypothetical protein